MVFSNETTQQQQPDNTHTQHNLIIYEFFCFLPFNFLNVKICTE